MRAGHILVLAWAVAGGEPDDGRVHFREMRSESGIDYENVSGEPEKRFIVSSLGSGAALFDYDDDGDLDLYFVNGARLQNQKVVPAAPNRLYRNEGGWRFRDVTAAAGVGDRGWGFGCAAGDFDNDGHVDLYVTNLGANVLYRNRGDGTFAEITASSGVGNESFGSSAAFFDADGDGDLDLYVANYVDPDIGRLPLPGSRPSCQWRGLDVFCGPSGLVGASDVYYRNRGDGTFVDETLAAGFNDATGAYGLGVVAGDADGDGDADLYVANDSVPNFYYENDGTGRFTETGLLAGVAYSADGLAQAGMGVDAGDVDGDGTLDLFVTNFSHDTNTLYRNFGEGLFEDATARTLGRSASWLYLGWATRFVDLDNDGDQDLFVANGHVYPRAAETDEQMSYAQRNQVFWNLGSGRLEESQLLAGDALHQAASTRGGAFGDVDDDGDVDVVLVDIDGPPSLLRNELPGGGNALVLRLVGTKSNRDGVGARVSVVAGSHRQVKEAHTSGSFLSSSDIRLHFGIGSAQRAEEIHVRWPSGATQSLRGVEAGGIVTIVERAQ